MDHQKHASKRNGNFNFDSERYSQTIVRTIYYLYHSFFHDFK
jgi:hypothetical protein